ncbi:MAG: hypothetical protein V3V67_03565 [Myxococcota bacterium]
MRLASWFAAAGMLVLVLGAPGTSRAEGPAVAQVIALDVNGDLPAFLEQFKKFRALGEKLGNKGVLRVWQATLAGQGTLGVAVVIEYPDLVTMAQETSRTQATPEWQALIAENQKLGIQPVSNSLSVDITP